MLRLSMSPEMVHLCLCHGRNEPATRRGSEKGEPGYEGFEAFLNWRRGSGTLCPIPAS